MTNQKTNWKYILLVVILAVIVGGGILWWEKTQEVVFPELPETKKPEKVVEDETAGWQTYRNEKYGFEIKYPSNLSLKSTEYYTEIYFPTEVNCYSPVDFCDGMIIESKEKLFGTEIKNDQTIDDLKSLIERDIDFDAVFSNITGGLEKVLIGEDIESFKYWENTNKYNAYWYYIKKENKLIRVRIFEETKYGDINVLNQMLFTFRFLE